MTLFYDPFLAVYGRPLCFSFNVMLLIQYDLYIIFPKILDVPSGEGVSTH